MGSSNGTKLARSRAPAPVLRLALPSSDAAIVEALRAGQAAGGTVLYDRYRDHVRRVLFRVLGPQAELSDLLQDVFVAAIDSIHQLQQPDALRGWLGSIAVFRARAEIRARQRRRLLLVFNEDTAQDVEATASTPEVDDAVEATYQVLVKLGANEQIAFALRFIDGMELVEVAAACRVSLATIKRRLARAEDKFMKIARTRPELSAWIQVES